MTHKWLITPETTLTPEERQKYWEKTHQDDDYENVWSMTDDPAVRRKVISELRQIQSLDKVLIPGCGSRVHLQLDIAKSLPKISLIMCTDYCRVVQIAASRTEEISIQYESRDSGALGWENEWDAIVIVNSVLSESDLENRQILSSCFEALRPGGVLLGFFPTIMAPYDAGQIENNPRRCALVDWGRSTFFEEKQGVRQIFYTPLRLRYVLREAGFVLDRMEIYFCDSEFFKDFGPKYYGFLDEDLVIYEHFVVVRKP